MKMKTLTLTISLLLISLILYGCNEAQNDSPQYLLAIYSHSGTQYDNSDGTVILLDVSDSTKRYSLPELAIYPPYNIELSPDEQTIIFHSRYNGNLDLFEMDRSRTVTALTTNPASDLSGIFTPEGVVFISQRDHCPEEIITLDQGCGFFRNELYLREKDTGYIRRLTYDDTIAISGAYHIPNTSTIIYTAHTEGLSWINGTFEIHSLNLVTGEEKQITDASQLPRTSVYPGNMAEAPPSSGEMLLFSSFRDRMSSGELYTMNLDGSDQRRLTYNDRSEFNATWSSDGRYISWDHGPDGLAVFDMSTNEMNVIDTSHLSSFRAGIWTPDDRHLVFRGSIYSHYDSISIADIDTSTISTLYVAEANHYVNILGWIPASWVTDNDIIE